MLNAAYTEWMLSTPSVCRSIDTADLVDLESAREALAGDEGDSPDEMPSKPYVMIGYEVEEEQRWIYVVPDSPPIRPARREAMGTLLRAARRTYGERFDRELRGAGLQGLLER